MAGPNPNVIDWEEALQQCGDDEEFLHELLEDFKAEIETQLTSVAAIIQNPQNDPYQRIMRAAHVIKGAAANLMCGQLRVTALNLEQTAKKAHEAGGTASPQEMQTAVQTRHNELVQASQAYMTMLQGLGL